MTNRISNEMLRSSQSHFRIQLKFLNSSTLKMTQNDYWYSSSNVICFVANFYLYFIALRMKSYLYGKKRRKKNIFDNSNFCKEFDRRRGERYTILWKRTNCHVKYWEECWFFQNIKNLLAKGENMKYDH